jgi:hypothetical protein
MQNILGRIVANQQMSMNKKMPNKNIQRIAKSGGNKLIELLRNPADHEPVHFVDLDQMGHKKAPLSQKKDLLQK